MSNGKSKTKAGALIKQFLDDRFERIAKGELDPNSIKDIIDQRDIYYDCQKQYKNLYPLEETFDLKHNNSLQLQQAIDKIIEYYCKKKIEYFQANPDEIPANFDSEALKYWGIFRKKSLGIQAKDRAIAYGYSGNFPVLEENRIKLRDEAFILLLCEKVTVGMKVMAELQSKGYVVNLIVTGGFSVCEIVETVFEIRERNDNFYIFILHDMEVPGYAIFYDLYQYFPEKIFSIGLNPEMAQQTNLDLETSKEPYIPASNILKYISEIPMLKQWLDDPIIDQMNERIQLISGLVHYIVEYIEYIVQNCCKKWNLNRVKKPYVTNPEKLKELRDKVDFWNLLEDPIIPSSHIWTKISWNCEEEFQRQNKNYRKDITQYEDEIELESQVLQKIVNTNPKNVGYLKLMEKKVNNLIHFLEKNYWHTIEYVEDLVNMFLKLFWFCL